MSAPRSQHLIRLLVTALGLLATLSAQQLQWDIPARGAHVYTRTVQQFEVAPPPSRATPDWVLGSGEAPTPHAWRYFAGPRHGVPAGFEQPTFDDSSWLLGQGEFGPDHGTNPAQRTAWRSEELCLRTTIDLGAKKPKALWFVVDHDDGIRIWLNGAQVVADDGYGQKRWYFVTDKALDAWQRGHNTIAVRGSNIGGYQVLDVRMGQLHSLPPGARSVDDTARMLREEREAANRVRGELFGDFRPPALLLQGELDKEGACVQRPPSDLRDLAWWLAMDLRPSVLGGSVQADAARLYRLGDLHVRGRATAVDVDGWQTLELTVKSPPEPLPRGDSKRLLERFVRPFVSYAVDGTLTIKRRLVIADGKAKVQEFQSRLQGRLLRGKDWKDTAASLQQSETWQLTDTRDGQDAPFRAMVQQALQRGTAKLREHLRGSTEGELAAQPPDGDNSHHSGRLAIGLLALLKGGVPKDDEVVQKALAELRQRTLIDTYSLANAIMALEALYIPANEFGELRSGNIDRPRKRQPSAEDRALIQKWVDRLFGNVDSRVDPNYLLRFDYTGGARFDNSVNQYGLLGLYSAHLCGIEIKPIVWEAAANHLIACQAQEGAKFDLELTDYRTMMRRQADPDAPFTVSRTIARANGWSYYESKSNGEWVPSRGSMTCAGITGLAICQAALQDHPNVKRPKLQGDATRARSDAFAWLAQHLTARYHPGELAHQQQWFYYYLYGLERAALLSGIALIQDRDWYFEGAMVLVLAQGADGDWPGELHTDRIVERDAMAILFLKQSTAPVLTGK
jgi:hypothetical protein